MFVVGQPRTGGIGTGRAWPPVILSPPKVERPGTAAAVLSDLTYLRGMEALHGREALAEVAVQLARRLDAALATGDGLAISRYAKELRATLAALGRPEDTSDDAAWIQGLSGAVGNTPQP